MTFLAWTVTSVLINTADPAIRQDRLQTLYSTSAVLNKERQGVATTIEINYRVAQAARGGGGRGGGGGR